MFKAIQKTLVALLAANHYQTATLYLSPTQTIRATWPRKHRRKGRYDIRLTVGPPNFKARAFIKRWKKAGHSLPAREVHLV